MKRNLPILLLILGLAILDWPGCSSTPQPQPPPVTQPWTNAARLPEGRISRGIAFFFPETPSRKAVAALQAAGAVWQSDTGWTLWPVDPADPKHREAIAQAGFEGATVVQYEP